MNYQTLLQAIELQSEAADQGPTRSLDSEVTQAGPSATNSSNTLVKLPPSEAELEWSMRGCLQRIERTLLQFERSAPRSMTEPRMAVQIDLEKELGESRYTSGRPNLWVVLSIARKKQDSAPPTYDSWMPSNQEVYGSIAAGAVESLADDDYAPVEYSGASTQRPAVPSKPFAIQAAINDTAQMMRENINKVTQRGDRLDSLMEKAGETSPSVAAFRRNGRSKTWYSSVWESVPSPTAAISNIQEYVNDIYTVGSSRTNTRLGR